MRHRFLVLLFAGCLIASTATACVIRFAPAITFPSGMTHTAYVAAGDFNGDGYPDLVVSSTYNNVSIFLGNGDGTFGSPTTYTLTFYVTGQVVVGDFNGDGNLDIAVVGGDEAGNGLAFFAGNGDGTFQPVQYFPTTLARSEISAATGDFENNGNLDIYTGGNGNSELIVGNGIGGFQNGSLAGVSGEGVAVGDFRKNGDLDVVLTQSFSVPEVNVLLGNGDGTFQSPVAYTGMEEPVGLATGDFDGDKNLDIAVTDYEADTIVILLGKGDGTFADIGQWWAGAEPGSVASADFNTDGKLDLAVADYGSNGVTILPGKGNGEFPTFQNVSTGNAPSDVVVTDVNLDGSPDLVVVNNVDNTVSVLLNAEGTFIQLTSSLDPAQVGEPVTFTATVTGSVVHSPVPSGKVTFKDGAKTLGQVVLNNGQASFTTSTLGQGSHSITATYEGNSHFNKNQSGILAETID